MKKISDEWKPDDRGRYRRMLGFSLKGEKRVPHPFYLGTNLDQAKARYMRLRELWNHVENEWVKPPSANSQRVSLKRPTPIREECVWSLEDLSIARELAAGKVQIVAERKAGVDPDIYHGMITRLAQRYPMVMFVAEDRDAYDQVTAVYRDAVRSQIDDMRVKSPEVFVGSIGNIQPTESASLHEALTQYIGYVEKTDVEPTEDGPRLTGYGVLKMEQAKRIKERISDRPLSALDFYGCQELIDFWRMRPLAKTRKKSAARPMSRKTCQNHIAELMRFLRWLSKDKRFTWRKPEDFDELRTQVKDIENERTSIDFLQVQVYNREQLKLLNKYSTPLERVLLLLGLNCGFKGAEQGTLLLDHVFLDKPHPHARMLREVAKFDCREADCFVLYSRNKSKVYGEFILWRQTAEALRWAVSHQKKICEDLGVISRKVLLTKNGQPFFRRTKGNKNVSQAFANKWAALTKRISKDHADFPKFPFSALRDTGSNLVRHTADGEVAAVFLCHGRPVKEDELLDLYTNRPFGRLFQALRQIEIDLQPVFDAAPPDPWTQPVQQYTTLGTREQIVALHKSGKRPLEIASELGVSKATVTRHLQRLFESKRKKTDKIIPSMSHDQPTTSS